MKITFKVDVDATSNESNQQGFGCVVRDFIVDFIRATRLLMNCDLGL